MGRSRALPGSMRRQLTDSDQSDGANRLTKQSPKKSKINENAKKPYGAKYEKIKLQAAQIFIDFLPLRSSTLDPIMNKLEIYVYYLFLSALMSMFSSLHFLYAPVRPFARSFCSVSFPLSGIHWAYHQHQQRDRQRWHHLNAAERCVSRCFGK